MAQSLKVKVYSDLCVNVHIISLKETDLMFLLLESIAGNVTSIFLIKEELFLPLTLHFLLIGMIAFMSNVRVMSPLFKT